MAKNRSATNVCKIYRISYNIDNKSYIGQTWKPINVRFDEHNSSDSCPKLHNALKAHGRENFSVEILALASCQENVDYLEDFYINEYNALDEKLGYNLKTGGRGGKHSEETKLKISQSNKGKLLGVPKSAQHKANVSKAKKGLPSTFLGKHHTEEAKKLMGLLAKERLSIPENNPMFGKEHSEETKALIGANSAIRNAGEGNPMFGKTGESSPLFGRTHSEETKEKMSKAGKGRIFSEEHRLNIAQSRIGKKLSPESIAKREATRKINNSRKKLATQMQTFYTSTIYAKLELTESEIENLEIKEFKYSL
jgi:group I intron endonuclease